MHPPCTGPCRTLRVAVLDRMALGIATALYRAGVMDTPQPTGQPGTNATSAAHAALAQRIAEGAAVMLKNDGAVLPLRPGASVAVIGAPANCEEPTPAFGFGWPSSIGCVNSGGGSGGVVAHAVEPILTAMRRRAAAFPQPAPVTYCDGNSTQQAAAAAGAADVAVVVVGMTSSEGTDRADTALPLHHLAYLRAVAPVQPNSVVVMMSPGAVTMDWGPLARGVVCFFLPGQAQAAAVTAVLYGDADPGGRLPLTLPESENE
eukprot:gene6980-6635_t